MVKKLEKSLENQKCRIERFEIGKVGYTKVIVGAKFGKYELSLKNNIAKRLWPGDILTCKLELYSSPDFFGDRVEDMEVATMHYELTKLKDKKGKIIYKK